MKKILFSILFLFFNSTVIFAQALSGNYTINSALPTSGTNFQSFNSFADSINLNGVSGNVIATVQPGSGPYLEKVIFNTIAGTSSNAQVTIDGSLEMITTVTDTTDRYIVRLQDVSFFNIKNLRVKYDTVSTGGFFGIHIMHSGSDISISHCEVNIGQEINTLYGSIIASGSNKLIIDSGDFHRINLIGNTCTGGGYGISLYGKPSNQATDIVIDSNTIYDFDDNGVYLREANGAIVSNNHFDHRTSAVSSRNAIFDYHTNNTDIHSNFISVTSTSNGSATFTGIYLQFGSGQKVYNNVIHDINQSSGDFFGISASLSVSTPLWPKIYYNTISIDNPTSTSGNLAGYKETSSSPQGQLRNNMISISQPCTGTKGAISLGYLSIVHGNQFNSAYNNLYVPGGNVAYKDGMTNILYPTLIDWTNASGQDTNSLDLDPIFISPTNSIPQNSVLDNHGISLPGYSADVVGNPRSFSPDIGAYEFIAVGISQPKVIQSLVVFPNPVKDKLTIYIPENLNSNGTFLVYNSLGKIVYEKNIHFEGKNIQFDLGNFAAGYYFIRIEIDEVIYQGEFLK